jgi:hypothetical protein
MLRDRPWNPAYSRICGLIILLASLGAAAICQAQQQQAAAMADEHAVAAPVDVPDAPSPTSDTPSYNSILSVPPRPQTGTPARKFHRVVQAGEFGQPLNSFDKIKLSIMSRLTFSDIGSTAFSAGFSQIRDSSPHFGSDSGAFGERLGALALKQTSQSIFTYGIYASLFHDDPRYYVMGRQRKIGVRALYSASRLVITQTDDGRAAINWPKFAGIASATALTDLYYPPHDHGFAHGASAFGVSLWTSILNNEIHEFVGDGLRLLRHNRN